MKKYLLSILVGLSAFHLPAQTAVLQDITNGLAALAAQDLVDANQDFTAALAASPTNSSANALAAVTRLLLLPNTPAGSNFLNSLGYSAAGRNIYNWTSSLPVDATGKQLLPNVNTAAIIAFYRTNVMAALAASRTNLARITDPTFTLSLTAAETSSQDVTLDYGDILLLQTLERVAEFAGYTANAQNGDVVLSQLQALGNTNGLTIQRVLALYPSLLLLASPGDLAASAGAFTNAAALYFAASDFIRNVRSPGAPALFVLSDDETNEEALFRTQLTNALASLSGPVTFSTTNSNTTNSITLNASNYFAGTKTLRSLLPQFSGDAYVPDTLPDYTFGGILVNEPAYLTEKQLRHAFYSYAGIYNGDDGVSDNQGYNNGNFAVFVGTNQQATLAGFDGGDGNGDSTAFGLFAQFTVDHDGNWSFQTNNVSGFGSFDKSGDFNGELDYTNGISVFLSANEQSPLGPFQNSAGDYVGTFSGYGSGALYMILAADGELFYAPVEAGNNPTGGGSPQLGPNGAFTYTEEPTGTFVQGALSVATSIISGTLYNNGNRGSFSATRAAFDPFDVPPAITENLPSLLLAHVGTSLTTSLTVTGSPPLSFQWYSNGIVIPFATTNTLVLNNLQFSSAGTYSVIIDNVAGETNATFTLSVECQSIPPTNQITAPTAGQLWSNGLFTVTGKAQGNGTVTNVFYSLNQDGWNDAVTANNWSNWTAQVTLVPGTNTLSAYALDACGNVSATNTVTVVYVAGPILTAEQDVTNGLAFLAQQNVVAANQQFTAALALVPTNSSANALAAVTRLLLLPNTPAGSNFLTSLGYATAGRNIYNWTSSLPVDTSGEQLLPNVNTAAIIAFYRTNVMAALAASRTNLARITDPTFTLSLTAAETSSQDVTLDYGDILLLQTLERAAEFAGYTANAQNGDVVLSQLQALGKTNGLTYQHVLALYPSLLVLASPSDLAASEGAFTNAAALYFAASDFIRNVRPPGAPALFVLSDDETNDEAIFRTQLTNALASLSGPVAFSVTNSNATNSITLNASNYFASTKPLRSLLPQFNGDVYVPDTLPDYTFGGILVNEPAYLVEEQVRHLFYSYAGIYNGDDGVYDSQGFNNGNFAVFVGTNQQATLAGFDGGNGSGDNTAFGLFAQFTFDHDGNWSFQTNNVFGFGSFDKSGDFNGELDYTNGISVYLYANEQSPLGPFQNSAGDYVGTFSSHSSGALYMILAADGELWYAPVKAGNNVTGGGSPVLGSNGAFTYTEEPTGTLVQGALSASTSTITGTTSSDGNNGTFKVTRVAADPFDVPPAITKDLPATVTAHVGTNLTVSLTATGSPPLCFQWYSNSIAIPFATTNSLVLSNLQFSSAGNYSVVIDNVGGETNSAFTLSVECQSTPPTNQITAPTAGQHWSNALFTVTGKAGGIGTVSNVFYSLNHGGWGNAVPVNTWSNWTAQVTLNPGTNTVAAYAEDTCGNVSATNTVIIVYIASAVLTVNVGPGGTVTPNDNGALLQLGQYYTLTAVTNLGFGFAGWTGSITTNSAVLTFQMASNLVFNAHFADTAKPTNQITAPIAGQYWSNALFTVTGRAGDNVAVSNVFYSLNHGGWSNAVPINTWSNWSALVTLTPGPNTVAAYAVDTSGNVSTTNSITFTYVPSALLIVQVVGKGTVSPNYSNAVLQLGATYTLTASAVAGSGFAFTNWTGGTSLPLTWLTNGPTVKFTMTSNLVLQANFTDTNRPVLGFSSVTDSNGTLVVSGTNNETVAQVYARLDGAAWIAGSVNTNNDTWAWMTSMTNVVPGTNLFNYYAQAYNGSRSLTNSLPLFYQVPALLTVRTNGLGSLSPNLSGAQLWVGVNYSNLATAATGFVFTNWTGGTNFPLAVITNRPTVQFTMVPNLILQANFLETNVPKFAITAPTNGQRLSNALAYVTGTASDDWKITGVWYQLNSNAWSLATSTNGWTNWNTVLRLITGTNTIRAFAANMGGIFSATNSLSVFSSNTFKLWLSLTNNARPVATNGLVLNLQLSAGLGGQIQVSTNLANWTVLTNFVGTNAAVNFRDPAATNGQRFYRAVIP